MSLSRRFVDLVRSNLTALTDRAADLGLGQRGIEDLSDEELEAELARRRTRRDATEQAARTGRERAARSDWSETQSERFRRSTRARQAGDDPALARLYAQLECPYGADLTSVRKHYRRLMRKYHPDLHTGNAEKQRIANELTQRLTSAYNELRRTLSAR